MLLCYAISRILAAPHLQKGRGADPGESFVIEVLYNSEYSQVDPNSMAIPQRIARCRRKSH